MHVAGRFILLAAHYCFGFDIPELRSPGVLFAWNRKTILCLRATVQYRKEFLTNYAFCDAVCNRVPFDRAEKQLDASTFVLTETDSNTFYRLNFARKFNHFGIPREKTYAYQNYPTTTLFSFKSPLKIRYLKKYCSQ